MALKYSQPLILPVHIVNGYLAEGVPEKIVDPYSNLWHENVGDSEIDDSFSSQESNYSDIIDLLPSDPFGMDMKTTFTAITGWLEDLNGGGFVRNSNGGITGEDNDLFAEWNLIWNNALKFQSFHNNVVVDEKSMEDYLPFPSSEESKVVMEKEDQVKDNPLAPFGETGGPSEALVFSLSYLGVKDLLCVEMACKSLHSAVRSDPLLWMNIHIDQPLNERITNEVLEQLANRSLGSLQCLSLIECPKITADCLIRILEANPRVTKLSVPGCTRLSIEDIVHIIKAYNSISNIGGIKQLRIGGFYGVTNEHFEDLKLLLGVNSHEIESCYQPHFYNRGNSYLPFDDNRAIDIEMCRQCEKFRLVYDCPALGCLVTGETPQACRACTLCVARCARCGRCVNGTEYEETFSLELVCIDCFKHECPLVE